MHARENLYNKNMARGWESKSVESQMEEAKASQTDGSQRPLTEEERNKKRKRENLLLARARILHLLEEASNDRYKQLLQTELSELDTRINSI